MAAKQWASSTSSLVAELLHKISPMPYKTYVAKINECDAVTPENFKNSRWANYFAVDSSGIVKNGRANPNHVFDMFGSFSGHTGTEAQVKLLENIAANMSFYERRSAVCLQMRSMNLETWVKTIANELVYCDELGLMGLCYMYQQHCVVLTQNKLWSTVQADKPLNLLDLLNICSVCLIYLGNLCFGVLTWWPHLPKKVATKSPGFNIIKEYTLDEANVTADATKDKGNSVNQNLHPGNVETPSLDCKPTTSTGVKVETAMLSKTDATNLPKADTHYTPTGDDRTSSPLQCVETGSDTKTPSVCTISVNWEREHWAWIIYHAFAVCTTCGNQKWEPHNWFGSQMSRCDYKCKPKQHRNKGSSICKTIDNLSRRQSVVAPVSMEMWTQCKTWPYSA